tara:strand:- start:1466 stop:1741 length:276 start_codon:yes stop_codon:yes gene_type:complete
MIAIAMSSHAHHISSPPGKKGGPIEADALWLIGAISRFSPPGKKGGPIEAIIRSLFFIKRSILTLRPVKRAAPLKQLDPDVSLLCKKLSAR